MVPPRDSHLLLPDPFLTDMKLDEMWDWFREANDLQVDYQVIFAKLVNMVRKPYLAQFPLGVISGNYKAVSDDTVVDVAANKLRAEAGPKGCSGPLTGEGKHATKPVIPKTLPLAPRVAIMSSSSVGHCLRIGGENVNNTCGPQGGGCVDLQPHLLPGEIHELESYPDGLFAFKSTAYPNIYLRASAPGALAPGMPYPAGGGVVNCQFVPGGPGNCGSREKFRIHQLHNSGKVAIEPMDLPGRYLRLDSDKRVVNLQTQRGALETCYLIFISW